MDLQKRSNIKNVINPKGKILVHSELPFKPMEEWTDEELEAAINGKVKYSCYIDDLSFLSDKELTKIVNKVNDLYNKKFKVLNVSN